MTSKYNLGDIVFLEKIFTPEDGGKMYSPPSEVIAKITRVEKTMSLGFCYQLEPLCKTYLGGVMYWEDDIAGLVTTAFDAEEEMWKTWGDQ